MINSGEKNSMQLEFFSRLKKNKQYFNPYQNPLRTNDIVQCGECLGECVIYSHPFLGLLLLANFKANRRQRERQGCPWTNGEWVVLSGAQRESRGWGGEGSSPFISCETLNHLTHDSQSLHL